MPGGRLTEEDRERIAAWLADGLGYAEIARRLGRPTSTISREVARNGVPGDYLAGHAQEAAGRRARRGKPARPPKIVPDGPSAAAASAFVDEFAALLAATGLARMTARVFVSLLVVDAAGLTSADLVHRLQVSPASVSKSIGHLAAMELVVRRPDPGGRRERYAIDDDVWLRAWQADTGAHGDIATAARRGIDIFGPDSAAGGRLDRMGRFFGRLSEHMGGSALADPVVDDALTIVAALVHAARPMRPTALATALGWPPDRVAAALELIAARPEIADPLMLRTAGRTAYAITVRPDRLTATQQTALHP
ncbi:helix-turn-helix domain-containing protein [Hamadaea tsunoensis]|uniref:helix-turn-helix domain-containing protein n=1 Tax=Hamadaea tsunoensis TaxID=53368 RepID=UPI00040416B5|nr:helix-turn-helix domain-containing protein [Hamadaea tsunoensis]